MVDNTELNAGTGGDTIASDDIGGVKHQRVKVGWGADGAYGDTAVAAPLPVQISDGTDVALVTAAGALTVSNTTAIVAGNNNIGDVDIASIAAGDNNIGNVDIVSMPAVDLGATDNAVLDAIAASVAAIDTDATTIIGHVDGIEGLLTTIDADTGNIATSLDLIDDVVRSEDTASGAGHRGLSILGVRRDADTSLVDTDGDYAQFQVDANGALKVEIFDGGGSHTVDNNGTFVTQVDGAALTALQLIDNSAHAHDAGSMGTGIDVVGGISTNMDDTAPPNRVSAESDATRLATSWSGSVFAHPHAPQIWTYHLNTSTAQTDTEVHAAAGSNLCLYVCTIVFSNVGTAAINLFFEETTNTRMGPYYLPATAGGVVIQFNPPRKLTANTALTLTTSASHAHSVDVTGYVERE